MMMKQKINIPCNGRKYLEIPFPGGGAAVFFSLAPAGDMSHESEMKTGSRSRFFRETGAVNPVMLNQIHSLIVHDTRELEPGRLTDGDGLVSCRNESLGVLVADCVPIFLYDRKTRTMGAFHSGWKGTGIAAEGIRRMETLFGSRVSDMDAVIGPSIGSCCYRVEKERYDFFMDTWGPDGLEQRSGEYFINLKEVNSGILERAGVNSITVCDMCTCCDENFFSYRRQGPSLFSRMLAYIRFLG